MSKRFVAMVVVLITLVVTWILVDSYLQKRRPAVVPVDAVFLTDGGTDVWVACEERSSANMYRCNFYAARSGELLSSIKYCMARDGSAGNSRVKIISHSGYESIETTDGTLVAFHPMEM